MARAIRIDELDTIHAAGVNWRPIRRALGITGFGINAYTAARGELLIEEHDETGEGSGQHEELYLVLSGHSAFTVDGDEIDAPAGTLVFVPEATSRRSAVALTDRTTAIVVGGSPGAISPSPWEYYFSALPAAEAGDPDHAYEIAAAGLAEHPDTASLHYNLACYAALAGHADRALEHLARAVNADPEARSWAATDTDLDNPVRSTLPELDRPSSNPTLPDPMFAQCSGSLPNRRPSSHEISATASVLRRLGAEATGRRCRLDRDGRSFVRCSSDTA